MKIKYNKTATAEEKAIVEAIVEGYLWAVAEIGQGTSVGFLYSDVEHKNFNVSIEVDGDDEALDAKVEVTID